MKKSLPFLLTVLVMILCSSNATKDDAVNSNSWSIRIGKKDLLASWKNNEMGDTAIIDRQKFKLTDTLSAWRYICGHTGINSVSTLTIKNQHNEVINAVVNKTNQWVLMSKMPLSEIFVPNKCRSGEIFSVFFSIESKSEEINQTVLLGKLRLK